MCNTLNVCDWCVGPSHSVLNTTAVEHLEEWLPQEGAKLLAVEYWSEIPHEH